MPLAMRLSLASRPEQPTVASYLHRLRPSQDMYFKRSTQSLELGPRNKLQQPSSAIALPNQAAQHTLYASPTALVSPATLKPSGQAGQAGDACTSNYLSASTNTTLDEADLFSAAEAFLTSNSRGQYDGTSPAAWSMQPSALLKGWPGSDGVSESGHGADHRSKPCASVLCGPTSLEASPTSASNPFQITPLNAFCLAPLRRTVSCLR
ncbi:hypothetical protein V8C86DRAFT_665976 [Haematococcus lacustris]